MDKGTEAEVKNPSALREVTPAPRLLREKSSALSPLLLNTQQWSSGYNELGTTQKDGPKA
jgi:hypothetical protein